MRAELSLADGCIRSASLMIVTSRASLTSSTLRERMNCSARTPTLDPATMAASKPVGTSPTAIERHVTSVATTGSRPSARRAASKTARTFVVGCTTVVRATKTRIETPNVTCQYPASDGCAAPRPAACPTRQVVECPGESETSHARPRRCRAQQARPMPRRWQRSTTIVRNPQPPRPFRMQRSREPSLGVNAERPRSVAFTRQ